VREGIGPEADTLPRKAMQPLVGGKSDGMYVTEQELEWAKGRYYAMIGWDEKTAIPKRATLESLDLHWLAVELGI
jgi:aldehyde:ferredoxin oxidoreductase